MSYVFNPAFIAGEKIRFYIYIAVILIIILLTIVFVKKELGKKK